MSLTGHLDSKTSPIGAFLRTRFPNTRKLAAQINAELRAAPPLLPPDAAVQDYPYARIGHAIDYRIRYSFALTPSRETVAYAGAESLANLLMIGAEEAPVNFVLAMELVDLFFDAVDAEAARAQPVGRAPAPEAERALARICYVLGLFEIAYRSPTYADEPLLAILEDWLKRGLETSDALSRADQRQFISDVLALVRDEWVEDLCQLSARFLERCGPLLSRPVVLNPTFAGSRDVGGADADLIVDRCLLEIKTTKQSAIDARWIHQLLGYVLLDYDDTYEINSLGFYLVRHGVLRRWPLQECFETLTGDATASLPALRSEFGAVCGKAGSR
jgi:hypothetical protein